MAFTFTRKVSETNVKITAESGLARIVAQEILVPDPPNGLEIIENATNQGTTRDDTESNRQNCS